MQKETMSLGMSLSLATMIDGITTRRDDFLCLSPIVG